jgi:hypothetical protein
MRSGGGTDAPAQPGAAASVARAGVIVIEDSATRFPHAEMVALRAGPPVREAHTKQKSFCFFFFRKRRFCSFSEEKEPKRLLFLRRFRAIGLPPCNTGTTFAFYRNSVAAKSKENFMGLN